MIIVIVHHWCRDGKVEAARQRIDENGVSSAAASGFLFRYRMERPEEPLRISTVTAWTSAERYRAWKDERNEHDVASGAASLYERALNEMFDVERAHGDIPGHLLPV